MKRTLFLLLALMIAGSSWGCGGSPEVIRTATARRASPAQIEVDPWALLPGGAVAWLSLDVQAALASSFGQEAQRLWLDRIPLSRSLSTDPARDIDHLYAGAYATVGTDVAIVARGRFDPELIARAAKEDPTSRQGRPIVITDFAGYVVYVLDQLALVPLSKSTLVWGTEIGVRRVLERIESGRLTHPLPSWFESLLGSRAPLTLGIDLDAQPVPATVRTQLDFLQGLRAGRLLGNFEAPGLNLAGALSYDRPETALRAAELIETEAMSLDRYALLLSALSIPKPFRRVEARASGEDVQVALEVEGRALSAVLARFEELTRGLSE